MAIAYSIGSGWFGSSSLSCYNDLVNSKYSPCGFSGKLDSPALSDQQVKDAFILCIQRASLVLVL
jgi:hypothetical protein